MQLSKNMARKVLTSLFCKTNLRSLATDKRGVLNETAVSTLHLRNALLILGSMLPSLRASYSVLFTGVCGTRQKKLTARHSIETQINSRTIPSMKPVAGAKKQDKKRQLERCSY